MHEPDAFQTMNFLLSFDKIEYRVFLVVIHLLCIVLPAYADPAKPASPLDTLTITGEKCRIGKECARGPSTPHTGVDYKATAGTPVYAICDGKVKLDASKRADINDRFLIIEHSNCGSNTKLYGYYGHIDSVIGGVGSEVSRGQQIATVRKWPGNTHLHFGVSPRFFSSGWGYQKGDPIQNGWLDPQAFLRQTSNLPLSNQSPVASSTSGPANPKHQPVQRDKKGIFRWHAITDRKQLNPQEICETWIRSTYSRDRTILDVRHVIKRDQINARMLHSCSFQYRLKPPGSFIHGFSLSDYLKPRKQEETTLFNAMAHTCYKRFGFGFRMRLGKFGSSDETKVFCEKNLGWTKVYK